MNVHYVEKKSPIGLSGKWHLPLGRYHVDVYVWVNKDGLLSGVQHADEDFIACYVHYPFRKLFGGLFGEIHIMEDEVKPGIVAHELTHALIDYAVTEFEAIEAGSTNSNIEKACEAMEGMTKVFWDEYFDIFSSSPELVEPEMPTIVPEELTPDLVSDVVNPYLTDEYKAQLEEEPAGDATKPEDPLEALVIDYSPLTKKAAAKKSPAKTAGKKAIKTTKTRKAKK